MADERDPERDQPLPKPGKLPVQQILIHAIEERREHGIRKYGRALETDNGRNALQDAWEEAMDLLLYLTRARLEHGDVIPGMERLHGSPEPEPPKWRGVSADLHILDEVPASLAASEGGGLSRSLNAAVDTVCGLDALIPKICPQCRHEPHAPGRCRSKALNLGCGCLCE